MDKQQVIKELQVLIKEGQKVLATKWDRRGTNIIDLHTYVESSVYVGWRMKVISVLKVFLSSDSEYLSNIIERERNYYGNATACVSILESLVEAINKGFVNIDHKEETNSDQALNLIFKRFHKVVRQLRNRYSDRPTLDINDEYDVQDLLHALLQLYFEDIRVEEWTPSYVGKSARVDFLLKNEKIVLEVKKTRNGLTDKEIGDQLIIDVDRYKAHPDCVKLICFVYDPEGRIGNPYGIMNDLNKQHNGFATVIIQPL